MTSTSHIYETNSTNGSIQGKTRTFLKRRVLNIRRLFNDNSCSECHMDFYCLQRLNRQILSNFKNQKKYNKWVGAL